MLESNSLKMDGINRKHIDQISNLCEKHNVKSLYVFGSVLTTEFNDESDIDFIVDFLPQDVLEYTDNYFNLKFALEEILKREIDLLEEKAIENPYFKQVVNENKQLVYEH